MNEAKPFEIDKRLVYDAYLRVKANRGGPGVDGIDMESYAGNHAKNLYKLWNRMSSGCYFPRPVKLVEIPKPNGEKRPLGIPSIEDRVAQMAVVIAITPQIDAIFHEDSYSYRPGKSAHQAIAKARERCWLYPWVVDMDISKFFDTIDHALLMKAVRIHVKEKWMLLYVERWLKVPYQLADGQLIERTKGVPQGSVIGPVLANLFLHYVFDEWMRRNHPDIPFERYADDTICHCKTEKQARYIQDILSQRFLSCKLSLNAEKTKIVYCEFRNADKNSAIKSFDYLGMTFRPRAARNSKTGEIFTTYTPAISRKAVSHIKEKIKYLKLNSRVYWNLKQLADALNPMTNGWINYYSKFGRTEFRKVMYYLNERLVRWIMHKYKRFKGRLKRARQWIVMLAEKDRGLFAHWEKGFIPYMRVAN